MFKRVKGDLTILPIRPKFSVLLNLWHNCCEQRTQWSQSWLHHYEWCFPIKLWHQNSPRSPWSSESMCFSVKCVLASKSFGAFLEVEKHFEGICPSQPNNGGKATTPRTGGNIQKLFRVEPNACGSSPSHPRKTRKSISFHITRLPGKYRKNSEKLDNTHQEVGKSTLPTLDQFQPAMSVGLLDSNIKL